MREENGLNLLQSLITREMSLFGLCTDFPECTSVGPYLIDLDLA
jgi:hypothetical protein